MLNQLLETIIQILTSWVSKFDSHAHHVEDKLDSLDQTASDIETNTEPISDIKDNTGAVITPIQNIKTNTDSIATSSQTSANNTTAILNNVGTLSTNTGKAAAFAENCANNTLEIKDKITTIASDTTQIRANTGNTSEDVSDIKEILRNFSGVYTVTEDAEGNICNFDTDLKDNLAGYDFSFNASQASGTPTPSDPKSITGVNQITVSLTGKNLLENQLTSQVLNGVTLKINDDKSITISGTPSVQTRFTLNSGVFTVRSVCKFSCGTIPTGVRFYCLRNSAGNISYPTLTNGYNLSTVGDLFSNISLEVNTNYDGTPVTLYPMIESGTVSTNYEKFKKVDTIISLGDTYYGGSAHKEDDDFYVINKYGRVDLGSLAWTYSSVTQTFYAVIPDIYPRERDTVNDSLCEIYEGQNVWSADTLSNLHYFIRGDLSRIYIKDTDYSDASIFRSALSGKYFVYRLAGFNNVSMFATNIKTFKGINNVWCNTGASEVTYKETLQHKIEKGE